MSANEAIQNPNYLRHNPVIYNLAFARRTGGFKVFYFWQLSAVTKGICWQTFCIDGLVYTLHDMFAKMPLLNELSKNMPGVNLVMLATDDASASDQVKSILAENELNKLDNWIFADTNPQKLRYEIDPKWYGEVPRTYFVDKNHQRVGVSGALSRETYETMLKELFN